MSKKIVFELDGGRDVLRLDVKEDTDIADVRKALKAECAPKLDQFSAVDLKLYLTTDGKVGDGQPALSPTASHSVITDGSIVVIHHPEYKTEASNKRQKPKDSWHTATYMVETVPRPIIYGMFGFVAPAGWMDTLVEKLKPQYELLETDRRVSPIALIRCSRGGKTRALKELAKCLPVNIPVLFVSFNEYSNLLPEEQDDPLTALCLRIAFAATKTPPFLPGDFTKFRETWQVDAHAIQSWLGTSDCVLMIDELNQAKLLQQNSREGAEFVQFLKENFLQPRNRMVVFSSHLATLTKQLVQFFGGSTSGREIIIQQLPTIPTFEAGKILDPALTARGALYCGLIPALIIARNWPENIVEVEVPPDITEKEVLEFLETFITGDSNKVPSFMVPFMDITSKKQSVWIPFHVHRLLIQLSRSKTLSWHLRKFIKALADLLSTFVSAKWGSVDGFECLFMFVYLIRALTGMCEVFLKPGYKSISFNEALDKGQDIDKIKSLEELDKNVLVPAEVEFPHLAILYPQFSSFSDYDVLVYRFTDPKTCEKDGFQLKEGNETPDFKKFAKKGISSYWIRGDGPREHSSLQKGWDYVDESRLVAFFGVSGKDWIPRRLKELREKL